jgi:serine/threonine-protein kinase
VPVAIGERSAAIEGFGSSVEPFQLFDAAFKRANGFEADIGLHEVTELQCPAVAFLARLAKQGTRSLHLDIERENLRNGDVLRGLVDHYDTRNVHLILVSETGEVQNVSDQLKPGTDAKTFAIKIQRNGGPAGRQPQLLIAIANAASIAALQENGPIRAAPYFEQLLSEAAKSGAPLSATARYVMLEK